MTFLRGTGEPDVPTVIAGRYVLQRLLGEGSRKRVFLARDDRLGRDVALALIRTDGLDDAGRARVEHETRALARLGDHPHVVTIFDAGEERGVPYLVSQYLAGGTLAGRLESLSSAGLPLAEVVHLGRQLCEGLAHAHACGVVHRDLKPANVWLSETGAVKLGDFGLAADLGRSRLTHDGLVVGTVAYLAPEQVLGAAPEPRSDLYALGIVLYELITGQVPFTGDDPVAVIFQHVHAAPVAPSWRRTGVPRALDALVLRLLDKVPEARPPSALAVRDALAAVPLDATDDGAGAGTANPLDQLATGVFVGRTPEMRALRGWVDEMRAGSGRVVLVSGEPGIGKTRTGEELATYARLRGTDVLWGRCYEGAGAPAFWPWAQVARELVGRHEPTTIQGWLGSVTADLAVLVPGLRDHLELSEAAAPESGEARFRLFDALATLLRTAARERPLVILLDDLHGADPSSLLFLEFLAGELREGRVLVVGFHRDVERDDHRLLHTIAEVGRIPTTQQLDLGGLSEGEIERFVELAAGLHPARSLVSALHQATDGNPFFVAEMLRLLVAEHGLDRAELPVRFAIPGGVRASVERRLQHLQGDTRDTLIAAAVMGREFQDEVIARVTGFGPDRVMAAIDEAVGARLVTLTAPGRYRFLHALVRDTLHDAIPGARREALHGALATELEAEAEPRLAEIAHHCAEAGPGARERAVAYFQRAADQAMALLAYEEAVRLRRDAIELCERGGIHGDRRFARLLLELAAAQRFAGDIGAARATIERAANVARDLGSSELLARAAMLLSDERMCVPDATMPRSIALLEEALAGLGTEPGPMRAIVQVSLAVWLHAPGEPRTVQLAHGALDIAHGLDAATRIVVLKLAHFALWGPDVPPEERLALAREYCRLAEQNHDREAVVSGSYWAIQDLFDLGEVAQARTEAAVLEQAASELRQPLYQWFLLTNRVALALHDGTFNEAERLVPQESVLAQAAARLLVRGYRCTLHLARGRFAAVEAMLQAAIDDEHVSNVWYCARAYVLSVTGRATEARAELQRIVSEDLRGTARDLNWFGAVALLSMACAEIGDVEAAAVLYEHLKPFPSRYVFGVVPVTWMGATSRYLGLLAATMQRWDEASEHFEHALATNERTGGRPWLAWTQHDYAAMLVRRGRAADGSRAVALVTEALETAEALGMAPLVAACRTLRTPTGTPVAGALPILRAALATPSDSRDLFARVQAACAAAFAADATVIVGDVSAAPSAASLARAVLQIPLTATDKVVGVLRVTKRRDDEPWTGDERRELETFASELAAAVVATRRYEVLKSTEEKLRTDLLRARRVPVRREQFPEIVGTSAAMQDALALAESAAAAGLPVLLEGETGTGKELFARAIHRISARGMGAFLPLNCAAIPDHLLESELFGHRKGAFTGATHDRTGLVEAAAGGTLFLDEIGEMPPAMQAKLLRVLQDGEYLRVGETVPRRVDLRIVSATNRDLAAEVAGGRFREDLFYRLAAFPIRLPPLRERPEELPALAAHLLGAAAAQQGRPSPALAPGALTLLAGYAWPGNVRELAHELGRAVALARDGEAIGAAQLSAKLSSSTRPSTAPIQPVEVETGSLRGAREAWEARHIAAVLAQHGGNVSRAAAALGLSREMLHRKLKKFGLR